MKNKESISGLEPETSRLEVGCSIRLSHMDTFIVLKVFKLINELIIK